MPGPSEEQDEQFYRDTEAAAFPKLDDYQMSLLEPLGQRRVLKRGDIVLKAGQRDFGLTIVLRGEIEAFEQRDDEEQVLATGRERDFLGDVSMLQGTSAPALRSISTSSLVFDAEMIGSCAPAPIQMRFEFKLGVVSGTSGTIARNKTAADKTSGRSRSMLAAMFAPFE